MNKRRFGLALFVSPLLLTGHFSLTVMQQSLAPYFFPFWLYLAFREVAHLPGYQDIQYGSCRFLYCDEVAFAAAAVMSLALYGLSAYLALYLLSLWQQRRRYSR